MAWIDKDAVEVLLATELDNDRYIGTLIDHAQSLAEIEVGEQDTPTAQLKAVLCQIVARMWQAGQNARVNPAAMSMEVAGPFTFQTQNAGVAGLGLTDREKALLKKAAGIGPLWVQPTYIGERLETAPVHDDEVLADTLDPIEILAAAQADMPRPRR
jgi:hypothetical protein